MFSLKLSYASTLKNGSIIMFSHQDISFTDVPDLVPGVYFLIIYLGHFAFFSAKIYMEIITLPGPEWYFGNTIRPV